MTGQKQEKSRLEDPRARKKTNGALGNTPKRDQARPDPRVAVKRVLCWRHDLTPYAREATKRLVQPMVESKGARRSCSWNFNELLEGSHPNRQQKTHSLPEEEPWPHCSGPICSSKMILEGDPARLCQNQPLWSLTEVGASGEVDADKDAGTQTRQRTREKQRSGAQANYRQFRSNVKKKLSSGLLDQQ